MKADESPLRMYQLVAGIVKSSLSSVTIEPFNMVSLICGREGQRRAGVSCLFFASTSTVMPCPQLIGAGAV
jgi:hypothetical protein